MELATTTKTHQLSTSPSWMNWLPTLSSTTLELANDKKRDGVRDPGLNGKERERREEERNYNGVDAECFYREPKLLLYAPLIPCVEEMLGQLECQRVDRYTLIYSGLCKRN